MCFLLSVIISIFPSITHNLSDLALLLQQLPQPVMFIPKSEEIKVINLSVCSYGKSNNLSNAGKQVLDHLHTLL